ncbi:hypothetical protein SAMN04488029_1268 [Reichenbachiella faecimaris]|uniref:Uncharacterized protein n=1 Tax=Reichenbachiella faecimaris TaxID=692418 RepID=A0A1W2G990_REIFA|nr:DUF5004 domain-containing protein [Reichenbachiella faecimaris]SMD32908.1 hypothetical protein SAMN04488029_1268 [Reichenbachiella faecimaris]
MMKKISTLILGLILTLSLNAQSINSEQLAGTWKVINGTTTSELPAEVGRMMLLMLDGFDTSTWSFNSDGTFNIKFKENLSPIMEEMKFLDNKLWKIDEPTKQIRIGTKSDNYGHLVMTNQLQGDNLKVVFSDTPIYLLLEKQ